MGIARRLIEGGFVFLGMLSMSGCDPERAGLVVEEIEEIEAESFRRGGGIWIGNGLEHPDVTGVDPTQGLGTVVGLPPNGVLLSHPAGILAASYLVECALPLGDSVVKTRADGQQFTFHGAIGLAPEWRDGKCITACQEWVSACLLARTNASGLSVPIWISADHPAIGLGHSPDYPNYEGSFYGNLFKHTPTKHLCRSHLGQEGEGLLDDRTCAGLSPVECGFNDWGLCDAQGRCEHESGDDANEYVFRCRANALPTGSYFNGISVYLQ